MSSLTLKNVPDPLLERLRTLAELNRRSLNQQAIQLLEVALQTTNDNEKEEIESRLAAAQVEAWKVLSGRWKSKKTIKEEIADIYRHRTRGRPVDL